VLGRFNAADVATLGGWQAAVGQDPNSFSQDPIYLQPAGTAATVDLHIDPAINSIVEGNGGFVAGVTDDFDG
jgi:hypothetical protein